MLSEEQEKIRKLKKKLKVQEKKNAEIRDQMSVQRTIFANERTLMAYLRTAVTVIAGGLAAIKFSNDLYLKLTGITLLPIGVILAVYSFIRYRNKQKLIEGHHQNYCPTSHEHDKIHSRDSGGNGKA
ncbi:YidH family protein [Pontibacter sp. MBLB2868]|uniref:YidH family protein n=1 Tax=Pontibacter sp. MBLB2868 TaxID=3451555 RepID=UPI003F74D3AC